MLDFRDAAKIALFSTWRMKDGKVCPTKPVCNTVHFTLCKSLYYLNPHLLQTFAESFLLERSLDGVQKRTKRTQKTYFVWQFDWFFQNVSTLHISTKYKYRCQSQIFRQITSFKSKDQLIIQKCRGKLECLIPEMLLKYQTSLYKIVILLTYKYINQKTKEKVLNSKIKR